MFSGLVPQYRFAKVRQAGTGRAVVNAAGQRDACRGGGGATTVIPSQAENALKFASYQIC